MVLGPLGRFVSNSLRKRGYAISRPTPLERTFLRSPWHLFQSDPLTFAEVYRKNRLTLATVPQWVDADVMRDSLWRYGVPEQWMERQTERDRTGLNDIEIDITTADLIGFLARKISAAAYLEIGVSVGKNILQVVNAVPGVTAVGLDVEEINPVLRAHFTTCETKWTDVSAYPVDTLTGTRALKRPSLLSLRNSEGACFDYLSTDQFREETWQRLRGRTFNLIYSDGVHSASAVRTELSFLRRFDLIAPTKPFAMNMGRSVEHGPADAVL